MNIIEIYLNEWVDLADLKPLASEIEYFGGLCEIVLKVDAYNTHTKKLVTRVTKIARAYDVPVFCLENQTHHKIRTN